VVAVAFNGKAPKIIEIYPTFIYFAA